jgi:hypothetical protein
VEFDAKQPFLEEGAEGFVPEVEEGFFLELAVLDDADNAMAFTDEKPPAAVFGAGDMDRVHEAGGDLDQLDGLFVGKFAAGLRGGHGLGVCQWRGEAQAEKEESRCFHGYWEAEGSIGSVKSRAYQ